MRLLTAGLQARGLFGEVKLRKRLCAQQMRTAFFAGERCLEMSIASMLFIFLFLPVSLALYYLVDHGKREYILLAVSLMFYAIGSLRYVLLFCVAILLTISIGRSMSSIADMWRKKLLFALGIFLNIGLLGYYKYMDFAIISFNGIFDKEISLRNLALPLGISFFTFKAVSYLADIYTGKAKLVESPIHDALYLSFFSQIQSGPITRYNNMEFVGNSLFSDGVFRFLIGFNKKVLLANILGKITSEVFAAPFENFSISYAWLGSVCYSLQLFFDFAGYSDMAIGVSEMFGYRCMENFNYPYMTESVAGFWRRWHISLSQWFRDYIYIPLGGSRNHGSRFRVYFNLFVVWILTGVWHGAAWTFIVWGLGYWVMISFERFFNLPGRLEKRKMIRNLYRILVLVFINCQWILFRSENIVTGLRFIKRLFVCESNSLADIRTQFLIKDYFVFIVSAVILCFPIVSWIGKHLESKKKFHAVYETAVTAIVCVLFICALSFVVSGQNNPFAYANF